MNITVIDVLNRRLVTLETIANSVPVGIVVAFVNLRIDIT